MTRSEFAPGLWRSPLPRARDVAAFAEAGGRTVVDLTQRERGVVRRACERHGLVYVKCPVAYDGSGADRATDAVISAERPALVHCFHGRDRTGIVIRRARMRVLGRVVLHRVGRNLNRAVRTCEALGVARMALHECDDVAVRGHLYGAAGRVEVEHVEALPCGPGVVALETGTATDVRHVDWLNVHTILIGGETAGLPRTLSVDYATIGMCGRVSGLTVEAALAIALHEWRG